jgi:aminoglycoside phosphotransferase (APT) family kinase protein
MQRSVNTFPAGDRSTPDLTPESTPESTQKETRDLVRQLRADGLIHDERPPTLTSLKGGVSSDIYVVEDGGSSFVVKRALAKLRVSGDWFADTSRNRREHDCLKYLERVLPGTVPGALACGDGYFVMEYLGAGFANWKQLLLSGLCDPAHAARAGHVLGRIHRISAGDAELARLFSSTESFRQLRIDPYLLATGRCHPTLSKYFEEEARRLEAAGQCLAHGCLAHGCLVHGDFSPKNLLIAPDRLVVLDCEVAWYGDPAFDLAFLLTHLLLKALHDIPRRTAFQELFAAVVSHYFAERKLRGTAQPELEQNAARLLLMLLLARVDGKSPAEYIVDPAKKDFVRRFVAVQLPAKTATTAQVAQRWFRSLADFREAAMRTL